MTPHHPPRKPAIIGHDQVPCTGIDITRDDRVPDLRIRGDPEPRTPAAGRTHGEHWRTRALPQAGGLFDPARRGPGAREVSQEPVQVTERSACRLRKRRTTLSSQGSWIARRSGYQRNGGR